MAHARASVNHQARKIFMRMHFLCWSWQSWRIRQRRPFVEGEHKDQDSWQGKGTQVHDRCRIKYRIKELPANTTMGSRETWDLFCSGACCRRVACSAMSNVRPTQEDGGAPVPPLALSRAQAADALGISPATLERLTARGLLRPKSRHPSPALRGRRDRAVSTRDKRGPSDERPHPFPVLALRCADQVRGFRRPKRGLYVCPEQPASGKSIPQNRRCGCEECSRGRPSRGFGDRRGVHFAARRALTAL